MSFLSNTQAAAAKGMTVRLARLAHFDFVGDPRRYWVGFGPLRTLDGNTWEGTGNLASISELTAPIGTIATNASFALSGVDARVAALARQQSQKIKGRTVTVYLQFYTGALALLDQPLAVWTGELDVMSYQFQGDGKYIVSVTAEDPLGASRSKSPYGYLNDTDQRARYPGDRGLELVGSLPGKTINWPS